MYSSGLRVKCSALMKPHSYRSHLRETSSAAFLLQRRRLTNESVTGSGSALGTFKEEKILKALHLPSVAG